ncbi:hypothetical protein SAMN05216233_108112 [Desulfoluna spongiiphila]|uniref:Uncharacterized protein n=1 Tax=Desulfoluna spongiiphila TaxID=419481 RepID=A0A1G5FJW6_9BACT|nr:hypothetical protein SAMN05216233_108112 [Desulfoluna spongiiphila]
MRLYHVPKRMPHWSAALQVVLFYGVFLQMRVWGEKPWLRTPAFKGFLSQALISSGPSCGMTALAGRVLRSAARLCGFFRVPERMPHRSAALQVVWWLYGVFLQMRGWDEKATVAESCFQGVFVSGLDLILSLVWHDGFGWACLKERRTPVRLFRVPKRMPHRSAALQVAWI